MDQNTLACKGRVQRSQGALHRGLPARLKLTKQVGGPMDVGFGLRQDRKADALKRQGVRLYRVKLAVNKDQFQTV